MEELEILVVGDIAASKFYHLPNFILNSKCPHCGEVNSIDQCEDGSTIPAEHKNKVGYAKIGVCSRCHKKIVIGFKL